MEIKSSFVHRLTGNLVNVIYRDVGTIAELESRKIAGVHAYCFCGDNMVVVYSKNKGYWTPPGGGVELGETVEQAIVREVREETNMQVLSQKLIGYQDIFESDHVITQTRSVCVVEPIGPFVSDPDGDITEIKLIDPKDHRKYFDWGEIGERIMARALKIKKC